MGSDLEEISFVLQHLCLYGSDRFVSEALTSVAQVRGAFAE